MTRVAAVLYSKGGLPHSPNLPRDVNSSIHQFYQQETYVEAQARALLH